MLDYGDLSRRKEVIDTTLQGCGREPLIAGRQNDHGDPRRQTFWVYLENLSVLQVLLSINVDLSNASKAVEHTVYLQKEYTGSEWLEKNGSGIAKSSLLTGALCRSVGFEWCEETGLHAINPAILSRRNLNAMAGKASFFIRQLEVMFRR